MECSKPKSQTTEEKYAENLNTHLLEDFRQGHPYYSKVYNIKFPGLDINSELNVIEADMDIKRQVGKLGKITKAGKNTLFVETISASQSEKLMNVKTIAKQVVMIEEHKHYNKVKGVVPSKTMSACEEDQLKEHLREQGVVDVQRVKIKKNGDLIKTNTYI